MRFLELPLLKRELRELAQRRRTYALRCLVLFVFALVFLLCYVEMTNSAQNLMQVLGQGNEITALQLLLVCPSGFMLLSIRSTTKNHPRSVCERLSDLPFPAHVEVSKAHM